MPLVRRRPLLRAAAVGGGAYVAGKRRAQVQEREEEQELRLQQLEQQQAYAPPPAAAPGPVPPPRPAGPSPDPIEQLRQLGELRDQGVLTEEEFAQQKARLLG
jgi:hypothetical protein